jgi:hypothetical protein
MSNTKNPTAKSGSSNKRQRFLKVSPLSDPRLTLVPEIKKGLRLALQKQNSSVNALLKHRQKGESVKAIGRLIEGMNELLDLLPHIEAAVDFAIDSGWKSGATQGVSEQNKKNVSSRHKNSGAAKQKMLSLWRSGKWKEKTACVNANYELVMREFGLWKGDKDIQKPEAQTFIRYLYEEKKHPL